MKHTLHKWGGNISTIHNVIEGGFQSQSVPPEFLRGHFSSWQFPFLPWCMWLVPKKMVIASCAATLCWLANSCRGEGGPDFSKNGWIFGKVSRGWGVKGIQNFSKKSSIFGSRTFPDFLGWQRVELNFSDIYLNIWKVVHPPIYLFVANEKYHHWYLYHLYLYLFHHWRRVAPWHCTNGTPSRTTLIIIIIIIIIDTMMMVILWWLHGKLGALWHFTSMVNTNQEYTVIIIIINFTIMIVIIFMMILAKLESILISIEEAKEKIRK